MVHKQIEYLEMIHIIDYLVVRMIFQYGLIFLIQSMEEIYLYNVIQIYSICVQILVKKLHKMKHIILLKQNNIGKKNIKIHRLMFILVFMIMSILKNFVKIYF